MNVVIVNCFDTYEERIDLLHEYFVGKGCKVTVIQSDFRHFKKEFRTEPKKNFLFVPSEPYYKNLSFSRLKSHYVFAKNAFKHVESIRPDLLYAIIPPNSIAKFAADYKKKNPSVKLIFDLIDLWPETMPVGKIKNFPPFTLWKGIRDNNLKIADFIITECNLYTEVLQEVLKSKKTRTIYLARSLKEFVSYPKLEENSISICYLGSINNIIDIRLIGDILGELSKSKPVELKIVGDGERRNELIKTAEDKGAKVTYYGKVYDPSEKQKIFDTCHFGLNIMKSDVRVGLTMKSIDYFEAGLPIINNIIGDSKDFVDRYGVGINVNDNIIAECIKEIITLKLDDLIEMRTEVRRMFEKKFSEESFQNSLAIVLEEL